MLLNSTTGDVILARKSEPPETISDIQFSPGKRPVLTIAQCVSFCVAGTDVLFFLCVLFLDGSHLAVGCHDNDVYIYELQNGGKSVSLKTRCKVMQ